MKKQADYVGSWEGSAKLNFANDEMSSITKALVHDLQKTSINLLASGAFDSASNKDRHELLNLLRRMRTLDEFQISYDRKEGTIRIKANGQVAITLPKKRKQKKK